jgi:hypothetical protein
MDNSGAMVTRELSATDQGAALTFPQLALGIQHSIAVSATNCWGQGSVASYTITPQALPAPVTNVILSLTTAGDLVATWSPSSNSDVSSVLVTLNPGNVSYRVSSTTTKVIFSEVTLGRSYQVSVTARNSTGNSETVTSANVFAALAPGQVNDLAITVDENTAIATARWNPPSNTGALISGYRSWVDGQEPQDITDSSVEIEGLVAGAKYSLTIMALSDIGNGQPTTIEFGLANNPIIQESEPGVVVIWAMPNSLRSVKSVEVQKKVGTKWRTIATVKAKTGKYTIAKSKKTDTFRVQALVTKKKPVLLKIKVVRK